MPDETIYLPTSQELLHFAYGRLSNPSFKSFIEVRFTKDKKGIILTRPVGKGIERELNDVVLRPSYIIGSKDTLDKIDLTIIPEKKGVGRADAINFLERLITDKNLFEMVPELGQIKEELAKYESILVREPPKNSSKMICRVKKETPYEIEELLEGFFVYMIKPCAAYARHLGEFSPKQ